MAGRRQANEVTRMAGFLFVHYVPFVAKAVSISHDRLPAFARGFGPAGKEHKDNSPCDLCVADVAALGTFVAKRPFSLATRDHKELKGD